MPASGPGQCVDGQISDSSQVVTTGSVRSGSGPNYFVFLLAAPERLNSMAGALLGITYDLGASNGINNNRGIDIYAWHLCATLEFGSPAPSWPAPGSGNLITWDAVNNCQTGQWAVAGYFYLTAFHPDRLSIIPRPADNRAVVASCNSLEANVPLANLGFAEFSIGGTRPGCNPLVGSCEGVVPVTPTTWSRLKSLVPGR
ncbi:MAG: hypothetical protein FD129_814 [bacterium]|nr:MAG: hypothetical protein FD129_814 [bacterium]